MLDNLVIEYDITTTLYPVNGQKIESHCNEITFINITGILRNINDGYQNIFSAGTNVLINGVYLLAPAMYNDGAVSLRGQTNNNSLTIRGNLFEIDRTMYDVRFDVDDAASGKAGLMVIRKYYKNIDNVRKLMEGLMR